MLLIVSDAVTFYAQYRLKTIIAYEICFKVAF